MENNIQERKETQNFMSKSSWALLIFLSIFFLSAFIFFVIGGEINYDPTGRIVGEDDGNYSNETSVEDLNTTEKEEIKEGINYSTEEDVEVSGVDENAEKEESLKEVGGTLDEGEAKKLITKIIDLRNASLNEDKLKIADLVSKLEEEFESLEKEAIKDKWNYIIFCVYDECNEEDFIEIIEDLTLLSDDIRSNLTNNIIETNQHWKSNHKKKFSKKLSVADSQISQLNEKKVDEKWKQFIESEKSCPDDCDIMFDLIRAVNE